VEIKNTLDNIDEIFTKIKDKIVGLIAYWERFRLSLPGRITIAKTFLISQLNYVGSFLKPSAEIINRIQVLLDNFVKKNLNIANNRVTTDVSLGGLGMFNISDFLASQRCMWISRAHRLQIDNWRYDLKEMSPNNNILQIRLCDVDRELHPILYEFVHDYSQFYGKFCGANSNYKEGYIFDNQSFMAGPDYRTTIKAGTFGRVFYNQYKNNIRALTFSDCFSEEGFKPIRDFANGGLPFTPAAWLSLRLTLLHAKALLTKENVFPLNKIQNINNFMLAAIKGSKRFRKILTAGNPPANIRSVQSFADLVELPVPVGTALRNICISWSHSCCGNQLREFIFKFRYNYLNLNNRVNAFNPEIDPRCTFCRIRDRETRTRDSLRHFFL
jgi:hypothetical protein